MCECFLKKYFNFIVVVCNIKQNIPPYVSVYKRSAEPDFKFLEFAGLHTLELSITNIKELQEHELQMPVAMA